MLRLEPEWWAEARKLKEQNLTQTEIGIILGYSRKAVRYVLYESFREANKKESMQKYKDGKHKPNTKPRDYKRIELRRYGREKFRKEGGDLRTIYRELGCE